MPLCFEVAASGERTLEARFGEPIPFDDAAARLELDLYLRVWEAINPGAWAARVSSLGRRFRNERNTESARRCVAKTRFGRAAPYTRGGASSFKRRVQLEASRHRCVSERGATPRAVRARLDPPNARRPL